jgi:acyl carrier protein phosphodiesterase
VRRSRALFEPPLRRFAGIVVDIGFDHFLSCYWQRFANSQLDEFAAYCYATLEEHHDLLPPRLQLMLPRMIEYDLLASYGSMQRLERVFGGVSGRVRNGEPIAGGAQFITAHYASLEAHFLEFFPDLMRFVGREASRAGR